jgi:hypothetical protein
VKHEYENCDNNYGRDDFACFCQPRKYTIVHFVPPLNRIMMCSRFSCHTVVRMWVVEYAVYRPEIEHRSHEYYHYLG